MLKRKGLPLILIGVIVGLFVVIAWTSRVQPAQAQPLAPESQTIVPAAVGTAFTYQGRLLGSGGEPVDGVPCRFIFTLWDAETGGNNLGGVDEVVVPQNGYFSVEIDFGQNVFTGDPRWMGVRVRCPEPQGSWEELQGRIPIRPAPYAMFAQQARTLLPGAVIRDTSGTKVGLYAQSGMDWTPPLFIATKVGGVWGDSQSNDGVIGTSRHGNGLYGYSETGKALYADGDAHVEGALTWKAKTSYLSLTAAAFRPSEASLTYENLGYYLRNMGARTAFWFAPVQLPQGAELKQLVVCWKDGSDEDASAGLVRRRLGNAPLAEPSPETIASVVSRGSRHTVIEGCEVDDTIAAPLVDNDQYGYYLYLQLPPHTGGNVMEFYGVQIQYEVEAPY